MLLNKLSAPLVGEEPKDLNGGQSWVRTNVRLPEQIYSLPPLTTRPSVHKRKGNYMKDASIRQVDFCLTIY